MAVNPTIREMALKMGATNTGLSNTNKTNSTAKATTSYTPIKTTTQINREDNANIIKNQYDPTYSNNSASYSQLMTAKANYEKNKDAGDDNGGGGNNITTTTDSDVLDSYYSLLADRLNSATNARNAYLNALYSDQQKDINGRYSRLKRELQRRAVNNGQDAYVTNAWNVDYAKDSSQRELDKAKLEAEATNATNDYSNYSSLYNSLLNSNASNEAKKKILGII